MRKIYTGAIFFGLLGSPVAQVFAIDENAEPGLGLKASESLGEAASKTATRGPDVISVVPEIDNTPFMLKESESLGGILVEEVPQRNAVPPTVSLPAEPASSESLSSTKSALVLQPGEKGRQATEALPAVQEKALAEAASTDGARFGIAPIQWGGDVSETLRWRRYTTSDTVPAVSTLDNMQMINLRASSYLWQPWIATVNGGIGLLHNTLTSSSYSSAGSSVTGNAGLSLFPRSRFPFRASYDVTDSRTSTSSFASLSSDYTNKRLGLQQAYRTLSGETNLSASFDRSVLSSSSFGDDTVSSLKGSYSAKFGMSQTAGMNVFHTQSTQQGGGSGLTLNGFTAQHNYRSDNQLTVDTIASLTDSVWNTQSLGVAVSNTSRYLQAGTSASWRPDEEKPLYLNGGLRFFNAESKFAESAVTTQSVTGNVMASYNPTHNISLSASGSVANLTSNNTSAVTTTQAANGSYNGDVIKFGKALSYNWNVAGGLSNQTNTNGVNDQRVTATGFHSLYYPYLISSSSSMNFTASQGLSNAYDKIYGTSNTLTHNGSISWNAAQSDSLSGSANFFVGDTRTYGYAESSYQFANLHLSSRKQFTINSSMGASGGINWDRQGLTGRSTTAANGSVSYLHSRAFNVRGLRYSLIGSVNTTSYNERLLGNADAQRTQTGYSLEQHLSYRIGKLDTSLSAILSRLDGRDNASIFVRIGRFFGNM